MNRNAPLILSNLLVLAALGWLLVAHHQQADRVDAQRTRAAAVAARAAGLEVEHRYIEAQLAYEKATRLGAGLGEAEGWLESARAALARATLARAEAPGPSQAAALRGLATALRAEGDRPVLASALEVAIYRGLGQIETALRQLELAWEKAPEDDPDHRWLRWQRATLYLHAQRNQEAAADLEALVRAVPTFGPGFHRLGLAYLAAKRPEAGVEALKKAVDLGAGSAASLDLAKAFLSRQMWAESIDHLETVLRNDAGNAEALRLLAAAYYQLKRFDLAASTYQKAHRIEPTPRTLISAVIALQGAGAWAKALGIVDELLPQMRRLPEIGFHRGTILERLGRQAEARRAFEAYLAVAVGHPDEEKRVAAARARLGLPSAAPKGGAAQPAPRPVQGPGHVHPPGAPLPAGHRHGPGRHTHQ